MSNLVFYDENIERNLNMTNGLIMAERLMAELNRFALNDKRPNAEVHPPFKGGEYEGDR